MCGLIGFLSGKPCQENYENFVKILLESVDRGSDATGIAYLSPTKGVYWIEKHHVDALEFVDSIVKKRKKTLSATPICIGHTRKPTTGEPEDNNNNHPIYSQDYIMIHNGTCRFTPEIEGYNYLGEVDSELMLAQIQTKGIEAGLQECSGDAAIALIDRNKEEREILLYRSTNPLVLAYMPGTKTVFFASTEYILREALGRQVLRFFTKCDFLFQELPKKELWKLSLNSVGQPQLIHIKDIEYGKNYKYSSYSGKGANKDLANNNYWGAGLVDEYDTEKKATNTEKKVEVAKEGIGGDGLTKYWPKFWHEDRGCWETITDGKWAYSTEAKVLYHLQRRLVRAYDFEQLRPVVCKPETAVKKGWAVAIPDVYGPAYVSVQKKMDKEKLCVRCIAPAKDPKACQICKDKSHWSGINA